MVSNILLDLDGTLTDPGVGITRCIQFALERLDQPVPPAEDLLGCIGPPLHASFVELLDGDESLAHRAVTLYRERFGEIGLYENTPYPDIPETLQALKAQGARLFVATSKPTVYARRIIRHFHLDGPLEDVFGSELDGTRTDKSLLLRYLIDRVDLRPEKTVMVGDRKHDMIGARASRALPVGVTWGYGSRDELSRAGAARLIDQPRQLVHLSSIAA